MTSTAAFPKLCFYTGTIDVVVVNLYPFYDKVTSSAEVEFDDGIENIDIGGPAMIRAAAKVVHLSLMSDSTANIMLYMHIKKFNCMG